MTPQQQKFMELSLETSKNTLTALKLANEQGAIADTIWLSKYETLFDYLESQIDAMQRILAQPKEPEQEPVKSGTEWFEYWNAVEGWVSVPIATRPFAWAKLDELAQHMTSVGCGTVYYSSAEGRLPLYTTPPQRPSRSDIKPLTDEEILDCWKQAYEPGRREHDNAARMARAIEAAHGIYAPTERKGGA